MALGPRGFPALCSASRPKHHAGSGPLSSNVRFTESRVKSTTIAEQLILASPLVLLMLLFVTVPVGPQYGVTEEGLRYRKVDTPTHALLLEQRWFWLSFAPLTAASALWCMWQAIRSALVTGFVTLPGNEEYGRLLVPWPAAWAYLFGAVLIFVASLGPIAIPKDKRVKPMLSVSIIVAALLGYGLFFLSPLLSSLAAILIISATGLLSVIGPSAVRRFGRSAFIAAWVTLVSLCTFFYYTGG